MNKLNPLTIEKREKAEWKTTGKLVSSNHFKLFAESELKMLFDKFNGAA